ALELDGGRYATPYGFVRALRQRALTATPPAQPDAVQLLTVHGAKGLEAHIVFVMDADPEIQNADTASVLVDWPVHSLAPERCAFLYSEARCPPSLATALAKERGAREREELNGLYVAMTRARQSLVFSCVQPHRGGPQASWWARVIERLQPWLPQGAPGVQSADASVRLYELPQPPRR